MRLNSPSAAHANLKQVVQLVKVDGLPQLTVTVTLAVAMADAAVT